MLVKGGQSVDVEACARWAEAGARTPAFFADLESRTGGAHVRTHRLLDEISHPALIARGSVTGRVGDRVIIETSDTDPAMHFFGGLRMSRFLAEAEILRVNQDSAGTNFAINFGIRF